MEDCSIVRRPDEIERDERSLKGYTNADVLAWCIESIQACNPAAEKAGVILDLDNHRGLTTKTESLLHIYRTVNSPRLRINWTSEILQATRTRR